MSVKASSVEEARRVAGERSRKLTLQQAREIRLSMESTREVARRFGVRPKAIEALRAGFTYGPLAADERAAHGARKQIRGKPTGGGPRVEDAAWRLDAHAVLQVGPMFPVRGRLDLAERLDRVAWLDANEECRHGRLPGDRTVVCGCWPHLEGLGVVDGAVEGVGVQLQFEEAAA